ncbi:MAG: IS982 family transposase [Candidatus Saccharimonadales bacterium]
MFVLVDDCLPKQVKRGARSILSDSELLTILIWDGLTELHKNLLSVYHWIEREYHDYFPRLPRYQNFVAHVHRLLPHMVWLLQTLLITDAPLRFADSTMLPVCKPIRADRHKVAKGVAAFGQNWQGWHYGFKLHASINHLNQLCAVVFTPANKHDNQVEEYLANAQTRILVGDSHYGGSVQRKRPWKHFGCLVVAPPHYKQQKQVAAAWQILLLRMRPKIEATFGRLKDHFFLVTSFPRSVRGYFVHYLQALLGCQMGANS